MIFVLALLCSQGTICSFSSGTGPCQCQSWHCGTKFFVVTCHSTVKISEQEIRAEERCLSAAEVVAVWGTGPSMQGFALWDCHLWPWLWGTYTGDDGDKMALRKVILEPLEISPIEKGSMLHSVMKNNCSSVLTKAIWNHILPSQSVYYFTFRSCFQIADRGLLNDYSVESTSEPILFPWGPHLSQLPVPENFTCVSSLVLSVPPGLCQRDLFSQILCSLLLHSLAARTRKEWSP